MTRENKDDQVVKDLLKRATNNPAPFQDISLTPNDSRNNSLSTITTTERIIRLMANRLWGAATIDPALVPRSKRVVAEEIIGKNFTNYMVGLNSQSQELLKNFLKYIFFEKNNANPFQITDYFTTWAKYSHEKIAALPKNLSAEIREREIKKILSKDKYLLEINQKLGFHAQISKAELETKIDSDFLSSEISHTNLLKLVQDNIIQAFIAGSCNKHMEEKRLYDQAHELICKKIEKWLAPCENLSLESNLKNFIYLHNFLHCCCPPTPEKIFAYMVKEADLGVTWALVDLGNSYVLDKNTKDEVFRLYKLAANMGDPQGQYKLGELYQKGIWENQNFNEAVRLYKLSSNSGESYASYELGKIYLGGEGVEKNLYQAYKYFKLITNEIVLELSTPKLQLVEIEWKAKFDIEVELLEKKYQNYQQEPVSNQARKALEEIKQLYSKCYQYYQDHKAGDLKPAASTMTLLKEVRNLFPLNKSADKGVLQKDDETLANSKLTNQLEKSIKTAEEKSNYPAKSNSQLLRAENFAKSFIFAMTHEKKPDDRSLSQEDNKSEFDQKAESYPNLLLDEDAINNDLFGTNPWREINKIEVPVVTEEEYTKKYESLVKQSPREAFLYMTEMAICGFATAQCGLGIYHYDTNNLEETAKFFRLAAAQGNTEAEYYLGMMHLSGKGVITDSVEAVRLITLAANKRFPDAQYYLGKIRFEGKILAKNIQLAKELYTLAAKQNNLEAQLALIQIYFSGAETIKPNPKKLFHYTLLAANQNHLQAQHSLAMM